MDGEKNRARPLFAMVSTDIRRDLIAPLRCFRHLRVVHFYRRASYGDLAPEEMDESLVHYRHLWELLLKLWKAHPDIVQGVEPFSLRLLPYLYVVCWVSLLKRIPLLLVTLENRPLSEKYGPIFARLLRIALRPVFSYARLIIYLNEGARRNVLSVGPYEDKARRLMYGTWGVNPDEFSPQRDGREPDFGSGPVLLFVGRLHPEKGVFDLLEAFDRIKATLPRVKLVMVGDGPARPEIERKIAAKGWSQDVFLAGLVKNRDLPPYFRAADVFVAPSITTRKWEEQVGMASIQAMACGVPVVSTHSGAIPEYVLDGVAGILVPERNPLALSEAILRLLADEDLRHQMGTAGRMYALKSYNACRNVQMAEAVILNCLGESHRANRD